MRTARRIPPPRGRTRGHARAADAAPTRAPAQTRAWRGTGESWGGCRRGGGFVQGELRAALGFPDRGLQERSDFTGFNWANVLVILAELGFMTNPQEDRLSACRR